MLNTVLVTGAAGFIGSNLVRHLLDRWPTTRLVALDLLTYSGHIESLSDVLDDVTFITGDIADRETVRMVFQDHRIDGVVNLAAESHVDRSIVDPGAFVRTNVVGTTVLLQEAAREWGARRDVRFHHVSTDEVYGSLGPEGAFDETTPYQPRSPYSASKAASDHFVRAWHETYGTPMVVTNCSNNYGPFQFPEKLIPLTLTRAIAGEPVPVYGDGSNVRDWLYVEDHCRAIASVFEHGVDGRTYCIGGEAEVSNLALVGLVLDCLDEARGDAPGTSRGLIEFVTDRPGHDFRYAMNIARIRDELGWSPSTDLRSGLERTVAWYLANQPWINAVMGDDHRAFADEWYRGR